MCWKVSLEPALVQTEQAQISQHVFIEEVLKPAVIFRLPMVPVLRTPELEAMPLLGSHEHGV